MKKKSGKIILAFALCLILLIAVAVFVNLPLLLHSLLSVLAGIIMSGLFVLAAYDWDLHKTVVFVGFIPLPAVIFCIIPLIASIVYVVGLWK